MLRRAGRAAGRGAHLLAVLALAIAGLALLGAGGLAWRLSRGPVTLDSLASFVARRISAQMGLEGLRIGRLALAWNGWRRGVDQPLQFRLRDVETSFGPAPRVDVQISFGRLLLGEIRPRRISLHDVRLRLVRDSDGGDPAPSVWPALLHEFGHPARTDHTADRAASALSQLRRVQIDGAVTVRDHALVWQITALRLDLTRRRAGGVTGTAEAALAVGGAQARLNAQAALAAGGASTNLALHLTPVDPAALAGDLPPALAALRPLDAPVQLDATLGLDAALRLQRFTVAAHIGAGVLHLADSTLRLDQAALALEGAPSQIRLRQGSVTLLAPGGNNPTTLRVTGLASRQPGRSEATVAVGFDRIGLADLPALWPQSLSRNARAWITENVTNGAAHDGMFQARLAGDDLAHLRLVDATGQMAADELTVHWLRPAPPVEHGRVRLTLRSPDEVEIAVSAARQGRLSLHDGSVRITGLRQRDQFIAIQTALAGRLPDILTLLRRKRLHLLSAHPVRLEDPEGAVDAALTVRLPLDKRVTIDQIAIHGQAELTDLHLSRVALDRDLDDGHARLDVDNDGLAVSGQAAFAGVPSDFSARLDFRDGPADQVVRRITLSAHATDQQLRATGLEAAQLAARLAKGETRIDLDYALHRDGGADADLDADLTGAALSFPPLGWSKPPGVAGTAHAVLHVRGERVTGMDDVRVTAPGLLLDGRMSWRNGEAPALSLNRVEIGGTRAVAEIRLPVADGAPLRIGVEGPVLDLSDRLSHHAESAPFSAMPFVLDASFGRVALREDKPLRHLRLHAEDDGAMLRRVDLETAGPEQTRLRLTPDQTGRRLTGAAADAGALFHALGLLPGLHGGRMTLDAHFNDQQPGHPLAGRAKISDVRLDAPTIIKLAQAMTVYGLLETARGPGVTVTHLLAPFRLAGDTLRLDDARAWNTAIGVTAQGWLDLAANRADLTGTIVPAYFFNTLLGRIPVLGRLFSPEAGGGVFAAGYVVRGRLDSPQIMVNPLTALTPGVLRQWVRGGP